MWAELMLLAAHGKARLGRAGEIHWLRHHWPGTFVSESDAKANHAKTHATADALAPDI